MAAITIKGNQVQTLGEVPGIGEIAPDVELVKTDLTRARLSEFFGSMLVLNIFPSLDTSVCAKSVRTFNEKATELGSTKVLCISRDLPFAQKRFCAAMGINNVIMLSDFEKHEFGKKYGLEIMSGTMAGLLSRVVIVLDEKGKVIYKEQVSDISNEPDYENALEVLKNKV